jgi:hypothetical protein
MNGVDSEEYKNKILVQGKLFNMNRGNENASPQSILKIKKSL